MSETTLKYNSVREWVEAHRKVTKQVGAPRGVVTSPAPVANAPGEFCLTTTSLRSTGGAATAPSSRFDVGSQVGKYVLTDQIGKGGTALVFRAVHRALKKAVAIKVLNLKHGEPSDSGLDRIEQLRREAELLAQLNHPNVVRVLDFDESEEFPYLVMEYVDGMAFNELLGHCGRLRVDRAARLIGQVAEGLSAARTLGIVHRDVKPGNILLARDGTVKLADLGLALVQDNWLDGHDPEATMPPTLAGTVAYVSPEQATAAASVDHRADVYSLGATFYHAVTGEMPFKGRTRMEVIYKQTKEYPPLPHQLVPSLPSLVSDVIAKMMAKEPAERYQTYEELLVALNPLLRLKADGYSSL